MAIYALNSSVFTKVMYEEYETYPRRPWVGLVLFKGKPIQRPIAERRARTEAEAWKLAERERKRMISTGHYAA